MTGAHDGLRGRKHVARPDGLGGGISPGWWRDPTRTWSKQSLLLALDLEEPKAASVLRGSFAIARLRSAMRQQALSALVERRVPGLVADLHGLVDDQDGAGAGARALAAYDDPATPEIILSGYGRVFRVRARRCDRHPGRSARHGRWRCSTPSSAAEFLAAT